MARKLMGFEGVVYYGSAGSTASTQITDHVDVTISIETEMAETTVAGDGTTIPIVSEENVSRKWSATLTMKKSLAGSAYDALLTAATTTTPASGLIAIRMKDYSSGKGFDGDCNVAVSDGRPLKGEQTLDFTLTPNNREREPSLYS